MDILFKFFVAAKSIQLTPVSAWSLFYLCAAYSIYQTLINSQFETNERKVDCAVLNVHGLNWLTLIMCVVHIIVWKKHTVKLTYSLSWEDYYLQIYIPVD